MSKITLEINDAKLIALKIKDHEERYQGNKRFVSEGKVKGGVKMINLKVPDWWDSIRAILALTLASAYCAGVFYKIPKIDLEGLKELATMAIVFYFVLKKRDEGKEKTNA